jgi:hypothetical protein
MKNLSSSFFLPTLLALLLCTQIHSALADENMSENPDDTPQVHLLIAPVIGYQTLERTYPYNHNEGMLTYGVRVTVGTDKLAVESEAQFGSSSETFSNPQVSVDTSFTMVRLGLRKVFPVSDPVHLLTRVGMEGYHFSNTYNDGVDPSTTDSPAWQFRPYVGAGLIFYLFKSLSFSVEEVYVIDTSWETGFGFRLYI